jgi:hypothetical protein
MRQPFSHSVDITADFLLMGHFGLLRGEERKVENSTRTASNWRTNAPRVGVLSKRRYAEFEVRRRPMRKLI